MRRRSPVVLLPFALSLAGLTLGLATAPAASATPGPGYVLETPRLLGETPLGLAVYVTPRTAHAATLAADVRTAVGQLRSVGLAVRWAGYGTPRRVEGVVTVSEGPAGCQGGPGVVGNTWPYWVSLPDSNSYLARADIAICPALFRMSATAVATTVRHELGHAVGLGHTNYSYGGSYQLMNAYLHPSVTSYRSGDVAGLRRLAAGATAVRRAMAPQGNFERISFGATTRQATVSGWALLRYYRGNSVTISVRDNGVLVARGSTTVLRGDVNRAYDAGTAHRHGFSLAVGLSGAAHHTVCATATSSVYSRSAVDLGCWSW